MIKRFLFIDILLAAVLVAAIVAIAPLQASAQDSSNVEEGTIKVTLLGVGAGPRGGQFDIHSPIELQTSTLVEIESRAFLFDAGRGVL